MSRCLARHPMHTTQCELPFGHDERDHRIDARNMTGGSDRWLHWTSPVHDALCAIWLQLSSGCTCGGVVKAHAPPVVPP